MSITSFSDTDFGFLKHLSIKNHVRYGVVIQKRNANYTHEEIAAQCAKYHVDYYPFQFKHQLKDPRSFLKFIQIVQDIIKFKPDVLYTPTMDHPFLSLLSLIFDSKKVIIALHDVEFHSNTAHSSFLSIARNITMKKFERFQVFSTAQLDIFRRKYPTKRVDLIPLPLKDYGDSNISKSTTVDSPITFLFFGNILPYKGLSLLLEALSKVYLKNQTFRLIVAGRCDDWESTYAPLISQEAMVIPKVGFIENDQVADLFAKSDYLILPYLDATQSGPLKIAFQYNVPIIASDVEGFRTEVRNDIDGYLFKAGDVEDLQRTIENVLEKHRSNYEFLKREQRTFVQQEYSDEAVQAALDKLFSKNN